MGEVYRAEDLKLRQEVALKFLPEEVAENPERLQRFQDEVRITRQISHPNVCRVYDIGEAAGDTFLSMEYIDGNDLAADLKRYKRLTQDRFIELAKQLCAGLAAAHDLGIVHRDLKPHNIMIDERGRLRITDFGLAAFAEEIPEQDRRAGTAAYQSPEQIRGEEVTARSDLYALGVVLYQLITGKHPLPADTIAEVKHRHLEDDPLPPSSQVSDGIRPAIDQLILKCLEKDPKKRPVSARQLEDWLDPLELDLREGIYAGP